MATPTARDRYLVRRIDRYELIEQVGTGGMSAVYRGRDTVLDREVAVKVLHPHLAARAESRARFSREARAVARLSHPNIVEIYDYSGDDADESWIVTEFVHGRTLRAFAEEVGVGAPEVGALVCRALADALVHAHAAGVIHRDLKPDNVMVSEGEGRRAVKLADFGIARILALGDKMTMTGALVGSPNHMAPEIIEGRDADARSDVFSLGTILYWLTTGALPFDAPNPTATMRRVVDGEYPDPRSSAKALGGDLARIIRRALERDPARRQQSAAELRDELDRALAADGLERPEEELGAFLSDPERFKRELPARLVKARLARGEDCLARGEVTRALDAFDGVLALEPGNPVVLRHLARVARRNRWRRAARVAALAAVAAVAVAAVAVTARRFAHRPAPPPVAAPTEARPEPRTAPPPVAEPAPAAAPPAEPPPAVAEAPRRVEPTTQRAVAPPRPAPVRLAVQVRPYAQRALLDGVEVARGAQRVEFDLGPGKHRLRLEHPCCEPYERSIDAAEAARLGEIRVPLAPRPALLRVEGDAEARVWLDGKLLGTAEDSRRSPFRVPVPAGSETPYEGEAELRIEAPGQAPAVAPLRIRAGQEITVPAVRQEGTP
ncbi:MAG TPA: serine/threonine-protein kinase [Anaeromyxobacteraceae bacterium]|nr:serine/threonine-protein kinase [Anaeromyxobacteraceae bacterium]